MKSKSISLILIIFLSALWLRELTLRRAIVSANDYMYVFITHGKYYPTLHRFVWFDPVTDPNTIKLSPGWYILYEPNELSNGFYVRVSMFGKVTGTTDYKISEIMSLPDREERNRIIEELLQ